VEAENESTMYEKLIVALAAIFKAYKGPLLTMAEATQFRVAARKDSYHEQFDETLSPVSCLLLPRQPNCHHKQFPCK